MADKSFGVKELNLLNASGTPTVTSPNNLNLNANTVAISTSCTIGNNLTVTSTTNSANVNVTGVGTLTRAFATDLSVSGISTISQPSNANPHSLWDVVNNGSSAYRFTGPGQSGDENNPNIYLVRGQRYIFKVNASGHPFQLRVANGGAAYSDGVTNNGAQSGNVVINVQHDAPAQLYYQCTNHGSMVGNIYIVGGPQVISGVVTATTFVGNLTGNPTGSGANLTNLPAANITGTLPAISGANLTDVLTTDIGGKTGNLTVSGISTLGIGTAGDALVGKVDLFHEGEIRLKTTPAGIQVVGVLSATSLDFTGANGAFNDDLLLKGASANAKWDKSESYLQINDGAKVVFGSDVSSGDLEIYHSGNHSYINEEGTGELLITTGIGTTAAKVSDGSITLYHEGVERLKTTASGVTISGNISGTISGTINGNASTATDLAITGATEQLVIQTGNNATDVITSGTAGYVLQSNGSGNAPTWAASAPANAIEGITLREDGVLVGSANSISTINFVGAAVTFTNPTSGIATVTISSGGASASPVMMSMIFG